MSGSHRSGSHRADGGGHRGDSGSYRTTGGSGGYRGGSGGYRGGSGSHRIVHGRPRRWRIAGAIAGLAAGVAACATAALVVLSSVGDGGGDAGGVATSGGSSPMTNTERQVVPDACGLVSRQLSDRLAPNADRTQADNYQASDRQNQCVWGAYTGDRKRQLTVELRAIAPTGDQGSTDSARGTFQAERKADESGKGLLPSQQLTVRRTVPGLGQEAYVVYSEDGRQGSGEAIVNVRLVNVLVTVHYSGGNGEDPLGDGPAIDGGVATAKEAVKGLSTAT